MKSLFIILIFGGQFLFAQSTPTQNGISKEEKDKSLIVKPQAIGQIQQIFSNSERVVIELVKESKVKEGESVVFGSGSESCEAQITQVKSDLALAQASQCPYLNKFKVKDKVFPNIFGEKGGLIVAFGPENKSKSQSREEVEANYVSPRWAISTYATSNQILNLNDVKIYDINTATTSKAEFDLRARPSIGLSVHYLRLKENASNFDFFLNYEAPREIYSTELTSGVTGTSAFITPESGKISSFSLGVNYLYLWERFFLTAGLSINSVTIDDPPPILKDATGSLGVQFGLGYLVTSHWSLDFEFKTIGIVTTKQTVNNFISEDHFGSLATSLVKLKYIF